MSSHYSVAREIHFSYAHRLMGHPGKCAHLHGHNGRIRIEVSSGQLDDQNMVVDFARIRDTIGKWIDQTLDHKTILWEQDSLVPYLKDAGEPLVLMKESPTAEAVARLVFKEARSQGLAVSRVTLWETVDSSAAYHE